MQPEVPAIGALEKVWIVCLGWMVSGSSFRCFRLMFQLDLTPFKRGCGSMMMKDVKEVRIKIRK